ncbi:MAG: Fis family transcriptional regulator [Betaproteobacteria bacterium HGW-Betaproteobacteria-8]|nr:MAG: Fis family transcriptional regulator [Betaproteobacteria bacterium HGW-Betaproteobacteria-8]
MIEEHAIVVSVSGDAAMLEIVRKKPCGLCGKSRGCGISLWGKLFNHKSEFKATNNIGAKVGDSVIVGVDEQALLKGSMTIYGIPMLALLLGALLGMVFLPQAASASQKDIYAVIGAAIGLAMSLLWLKGHAAGHAYDPSHQPVILRVDNQVVMNLKCERGE